MSPAYRPRVSPGPPAVGAGLALAVVSAVTFGLSGPFAKALIDAGWSATGTVLVRLGGAAVVLAVILAATRPGVLVAIRRDGFGLLLYGVLAPRAHTARRTFTQRPGPLCRARGAV